MALKTIPTYTYSYRPYEKRATWELNPHQVALLVHDMQNYFVSIFEDETAGQIQQAINNTSALIKSARDNGIPVYYTAQPPRQDPKDRALLTDIWGQGLQQDADAEIISALAPAEQDTVLTKWRYSAFAKSTFEEDLKLSGRNQLIITGVYAHIGCMTTALDAFMRDIQVFFVADALADFSQKEHELACNYVAQRCGIVTSTQDILRTLSGQD
ncbi:isochorismatase family protein [Rothia sp. CCM 9418]|uniref:isochorismatase family protein n=1 Tax=Rothia sp. CCM 9418 TaxID=3402661 RepID=UPI003AD8FA51